MVDAREFLDYIASHLVENGGYVGSAEIRFERLKEWLNEMETEKELPEKKLTVKELSEQYGALDLLTAYIMRTGGVSEEDAEEMVYAFDMDAESHLQQILEDKLEDTVREIVYDISGEEPNDEMIEDICALIEENDVVYYDAIYKLVDDYINR